MQTDNIAVPTQNQVTELNTVEEAQNLLDTLGIVHRPISGSTPYLVDAELFDAAGLKYNKDSIRKVRQRVIEQNGLVEGKDYRAVHPDELTVTTTVTPDSTVTTAVTDKKSPKAKVYVFTLEASCHVVLSAHTDKGKVARKKVVKAVITKCHLERAVLGSATLGEAKEAAVFSQENNVHELMNMQKPAQRLKRLIDTDTPLDTAVQEILKSAANNPSATYKDRIRFAESLRYSLNSVIEERIRTAIGSSNMMISHLLLQQESATNHILKYEKRLARHQLALAKQETE